MKKHLSNLLLLAIALLLCSGCANTVMPSTEPSDTSKTSQQKIEELIEDLPENVDYAGRTLTVLTADKSKFLYDETAAGTVKNAVRERGEALKLAYDIELAAVSCKEENALSTLQDAEKAGVPAADVLCFSAETTVAMQLAGLLADLKTLPNFDPSMSAFAAAGANELAFGKSLYLLPETCTLPYDEAYVLFYNRDLVRSSGLSLPENEVRTGNWTFGKCKSYIETVAAGVVNKSSVDYANDLFGLGCTDNKGLLPDLLRQSAGIRMFRTENGRPKLATDYIALGEDTSALKALYDSAAHYPKDGNDPRKAFEAGRLAFYVEKLPYFTTLASSSPFDFGVLPLPTNQIGDGDNREFGYYTPLSTSACVFSVPKLTNNAGLSGLALTAFCTTGGSAFSENEITTLITLYARDNDQSYMLKTIVDSVSFDFGTVYGSQIKQIRALSSGLFTEVLANGARFRNEISEKTSAFEKFVSQNFS